MSTFTGPRLSTSAVTALIEAAGYAAPEGIELQSPAELPDGVTAVPSPDFDGFYMWRDDALEAQRDTVQSLLSQLPPSFQSEDGEFLFKSIYTFDGLLDAEFFALLSDDEDAVQRRIAETEKWTEHPEAAEVLFAAGAALGLVRYLLPGELEGAPPVVLQMIATAVVRVKVTL